MEIKDTLKKPYTDKARADFIVENNYQKSYEIRETDTELQAWGYTEEEQQEQKQQKEDEEKDQALEQAIDELGKEMLKAQMCENKEWIAEIKAQYQTLMSGDEE